MKKSRHTDQQGAQALPPDRPGHGVAQRDGIHCQTMVDNGRLEHMQRRSTHDAVRPIAHELRA